MPENKYRADPCERLSLNQTLATVLLEETPWHAWRLHPRGGGKADKSNPAQEEGQVIHALVFGDKSGIAVLDVKDYRTKAAQDLKARAIDDGLIPVKATDLAEYEAIAKGIRDALTTLDPGFALDKAKPGRVAIWEERNTLCRARVDCMVGSCIYELKTIEKATEAAIERAIRAHGYHVQRAAYVSAAEHIDPRMAGRIDYALVFAEKETGAVRLIEMSGTLREIGERRWRAAVDAWGRCVRAGKWPGYPAQQATRIETGEWVLAAESETLRRLEERMVGT